jgi:hypothetical protein
MVWATEPWFVFLMIGLTIVAVAMTSGKRR